MKTDKLIQVIVLNPPTKEQAKEKLSALEKFLSNTWIVDKKEENKALNPLFIGIYSF